MTGDACVNKCWELKKTNGKINGVVMVKDGRPGCWCELGMTKIKASNTYKTCFFRDKTKGESDLLILLQNFVIPANTKIFFFES